MTTHDGDQESVEVQVRQGQTAFVWRSAEAVDEDVEMAYWDPAADLLTIFPHMASLGGLQQQFSQVTELQIHGSLLSRRDPESCIDQDDRGIGLELTCLPDGFGRIFRYGLGLRRHYRGFIRQVEDHGDCTSVRLGSSGPEGPDGPVFRTTLARFEAFKRTVDRNRGRGTAVVAKVNATEAHNAVADLLDLKHQTPNVGRHPVIKAMTRELSGHPVLDTDERRMLVQQASKESRAAATETPVEFGQLRRDIELVTLEVLIEQFDKSMSGTFAKDESHWQRFFETNTFALQQLFAVPVALYGSQLTVKGINAAGEGSRIADFVLVNGVTRTAIVVEIKTPAAGLTGSVYRGAGGAEVFLPHKDLMAAVTQIQAQMESVRIHLPVLLGQTPRAEPLDTVVVRGAAIVGTAGTLSAEQMASFLRYRDGLVNVDVIAFDEVRDRLEILRELLAVAPSPD